MTTKEIKKQSLTNSLATGCWLTPQTLAAGCWLVPCLKNNWNRELGRATEATKKCTLTIFFHFVLIEKKVNKLNNNMILKFNINVQKDQLAEQ